MILATLVILILVAIACWSARGQDNGSHGQDAWKKYRNGGGGT